MISGRLRWWRARGPTCLSWSALSSISRQQHPRGHGGDGRRGGDADRRQPPAPHQAQRRRERAAHHQRQAGSGVDRRRGTSGVAGRHQPGRDRGDHRPHQPVGHRTDRAPGGQHREVGCQRGDHLRDRQADQADHQRPPPRPVRRPPHQRKRRQRRNQGIPGEQGADQGDADVQIPGDRRQRAHRQDFGGDIDESRRGQHCELRGDPWCPRSCGSAGGFGFGNHGVDAGSARQPYGPRHGHAALTVRTAATGFSQGRVSTHLEQAQDNLSDQERTRRAMAAEASAILSSASLPPSATARVTQ